MKKLVAYLPGLLLAIALAAVSYPLSALVPKGLVSPGVFALLIGMALNPLVTRYGVLKPGVQLSAKKVLQTSIVLMGATLGFAQVVEVGKFSLIVMTFTLAAAFLGGYLLGKLLGLDWRLSGLISAGTGICGGSAIAAIAPVIDAPDKHIAYALSATFLFDILMVILFPLIGRAAGMTDLGFGLWTGTAVNDTSSVVAAGYAFSDAAGAYAVIVKLTRTLSIIPAVLLFSLAHRRSQRLEGTTQNQRRVSIAKLFPFFILLFLGMVALKSVGVFSAEISKSLSLISKFMMAMALGAIGLKTNFREVSASGLKPMLHGFILSVAVAAISFFVQLMLGQM